MASYLAPIGQIGMHDALPLHWVLPLRLSELRACGVGCDRQPHRALTAVDHAVEEALRVGVHRVAAASAGASRSALASPATPISSSARPYHGSRSR